MNALVTGANGFIGSFLVKKLLDYGYNVRCSGPYFSDAFNKFVVAI